MKKARYVPLLALLLFALAPPAPAQVTIGAFGDLNMAGLSGDKPEGFSYGGNTGFGFGVIGEFHLTDDVWLSVQPMSLPRGAAILLEVDDEEEEDEDSSPPEFSGGRGRRRRGGRPGGRGLRSRARAF